MEFKDLREFFIPAVGKVTRAPNRLKKGFLKKSIFTFHRGSTSKRKQGDREMARRRRQIQRGIISVNG